MFGELCMTGNVLLSQSEFTWNICFKSCFSAALACVPLGAVWRTRRFSGPGSVSREPFILGHGAQPERQPPPHLSHTAHSWGSWCYTIPRWPASGSGFGMQQCSSLAAIYWKPALHTRVCKRINNNNNRKIQKKNTNNRNERKKKSWFFRRCIHLQHTCICNLEEDF